MSIRIYPLTQKRSNLEQLAGVPCGTFEKLLEQEKRYPVLTDFNAPDLGASALAKLSEEEYCLLAFKTAGFGSVPRHRLQEFLNLVKNPSGSTNDKRTCQKILKLMNLPAEDLKLCEGLGWL